MFHVFLVLELETIFLYPVLIVFMRADIQKKNEKYFELKPCKNKVQWNTLDMNTQVTELRGRVDMNFSVLGR